MNHTDFGTRSRLSELMSAIHFRPATTMLRPTSPYPFSEIPGPNLGASSKPKVRPPNTASPLAGLLQALSRYPLFCLVFPIAILNSRGCLAAQQTQAIVRLYHTAGWLSNQTVGNSLTEALAPTSSHSCHSHNDQLFQIKSYNFGNICPGHPHSCTNADRSFPSLLFNHWWPLIRFIIFAD